MEVKIKMGKPKTYDFSGWATKFNCKCGDAEDVADALFLLSRDSSLRKMMGNNSRKLGLERFDRRQSYMNIVNVIENMQ